MKSIVPDPVELAQALVRKDTCNPPGNEGPVADMLASLLRTAGFSVELYDLASGRPSLIARLPGRENIPPLFFSGHLDTVPVGTSTWAYPPFSATIQDGRLHGCGAADMKSGVAAMVAAAMQHAFQPTARRGLTLVLTAGEETGCLGGQDLAARNVLGQAYALVVGEPTSNQPRLGHKGVIWIRMHFQGMAAHGSMPELGSNAIIKASRAALALDTFFGDAPRHPKLGKPTASVNVMSGHHKINIVPDNAFLEIDIRPLPGMDKEDVIRALRQTVPDPCEITVLSSQQGFWTDEHSVFARDFFQIVRDITGKPTLVDGISYFTDASPLLSAFGTIPAIICGPGNPAHIHKTDEWCAVQDIFQARDIYYRICQKCTE